ncbi:MAG TPA: hypothetical protein VFB73_13515 [Chloroflexota bacterium]|nr:hypothetical protein [Chloroflexota bacterium]
MLLKTLRFVSIVCAALALGLTVAHVLERPGKAQLSGAEWLLVQHTFYGGFAVVGGLAEVLGLLTSLGTLVLLRGRRTQAMLALLGALSFAGMLLSYAAGNRPINDLVAAWTPASLPPDWTVYRDRWDGAHALSALFAALALGNLLAGALREAPSCLPSASARRIAAESSPRQAVRMM